MGFVSGGLPNQARTVLGEADITINTSPTGILVGQSGVGSIPAVQFTPTSIQATGGFVQQQAITQPTISSGSTFQQAPATFASLTTGGLLQSPVQNQPIPAFTSVSAGFPQPGQPTVAGASTGNVVGQMFVSGGLPNQARTMVGESDITISTSPTGTLVGQAGISSIPAVQYMPTPITSIPTSITSLPSPAISETIAVNTPMISPVKYNAATSVPYNPAAPIPSAAGAAGGVGAK